MIYRNVPREIWPRDVQTGYTAGDESFDIQGHFFRLTQDVPRRDQRVPCPKEEAREPEVRR